ncbi:hypothetical protein EIK77_007328 [Talaromyces pinophilus]|nr:hypothetical protein EIK77_007328 [Talaromyces pinophilus]PCH02324.1 Hypothetical protein PENO1_038250 [Penicillium occitanis (nom. inval.)]PCH03183.1 hypothetical protein PENOC_039780 [Penicillium occitanis (nom. inval.)]
MARNTRRRAVQQRNRKVIDILNGVAEDQEDDDGAHATTIEQHIDAESVDQDHGDGQRQTRRSARLNKGIARDVAPAPITILEPPDSPMFFSDHVPESEPEDAADEEADEADEGEDERGVEEDGDSVESEEDTSMSDHEQQLWQEQEKAIANSQQEQLELGQALLSSPPPVVIDRKKERIRDKEASTKKAAETTSTRAVGDHINFFPEVNEFEDSEFREDDVNAEGAESQQETDNDEEPALDDGFNMDDSRQDTGNAMRSLFDWDDGQPAEPVQRARLVDRLETQSPQLSESSSRKRKRTSNASADEPDRTRRRIELQNQNEVAARRRAPIALPANVQVATSPEMPTRTRQRRESQNRNIEPAPSRRPPVARNVPDVADWEAAMPEERTQDQVIVVGESTTYDNATKVQDLQGTWKRLLEYCQKIKKKEVTRMWRYTRVEELVERITDLLKDYKRMQRTRSRGRAIDPDTWKRTRQEVKYISEDADKIREVILRRAKEGKARNDLQAQADAIEYAHVIVQQVMTSLCELALECLKTYYSEEDECLLNGGFGAVLDIIDIVGELDTTLKSLHNCAMVVLSPYPGLPIRQELGSIRRSFKNAEANELRRAR